MAERYLLGGNRIIYKSMNFQEGLEVFVDLYRPDFTRELSIILTELGDGLYYFEYNFSQVGVYTGIFYENGEKKISQNFKIEKSVTGRMVPGTNLINI